MCSNKVLFKVVASLNLAKHYEINSDDLDYKNLITSKVLLSKISININEDASIDVFATDKSNVKAAEIANKLVAILDSVGIEEVYEKNQKNIVYFYERIKNLNQEIERIYKSPNENKIRIESLNFELSYLNNSLLFVSNLNKKQFHTIDIVEKAYPNIEKSEPIRSRIIFMGTIAGFAFIILALICKELYLKINKN